MARVSPTAQARKPSDASRESLTALMPAALTPAPQEWQQLAAQYRFNRNMAQANAGTQFESRYRNKIANLELQVGSDRLERFLTLVNASPKRELFVQKNFKANK